MSKTKIPARSTHPGLSRLEESRLRARLRRQAPSEPWVDAQFIATTLVDSDGKPRVRRLHNPNAFPPGGSRTAMIRCPLCGVFTPPHAFEEGICLDHRDNGHWGPSPSAQTIAALQYRNLRMTETPLPSESVSVLRAEIRKHLSR